jgi:hypothetical protein
MKKIFGVEAYVLNFDLKKMPKEGIKPFLTLEMLKEYEKEPIPE